MIAVTIFICWSLFLAKENALRFLGGAGRVQPATCLVFTRTVPDPEMPGILGFFWRKRDGSGTMRPPERQMIKL
jgi:hypothetical protein